MKLKIKKTLNAILVFSLLTAVSPVFAAVSIIDDAGKNVSLPAPAMRVIALYAGLGEILTVMGLENRVVGRTASDDALPQDLPVVGTHMRPNPELVLGLAPDLVLQFEGREEAGITARTLERLGLRVARFRIASFADLFSCMQRLGVLMGAEKAAADLERVWRARLDKARSSQGPAESEPTVFFEVRYPNLLGAGAGGMVHDIIEHAGGRNCLAAYPERMVRLNEEALAAADPDIYLVQQGAMNKKPTAPELRPHFRGLSAVQGGRVHFVDERLYSRPGPGSITAVEELSELVRRWQSDRNKAFTRTPCWK